MVPDYYSGSASEWGLQTMKTHKIKMLQ